MTRQRKALRIGALVVATLAMGSIPAKAQQAEGQSCSGEMTQQLRRFSEKCLSDLLSFVAAKPKMSAKIYSENEKYYVTLIQDGKGLRAEAVSRLNFPLMKSDTETALRQLGWTAPENEGDNWKKQIGAAPGQDAVAAEDLGKALAAYGLKRGDAISLTVSPDISG